MMCWIHLDRMRQMTLCSRELEPREVEPGDRHQQSEDGGYDAHGEFDSARDAEL